MLLKFFTVIFYSDGKFIPSHLYLFIKVLIFVILSGFSPFSSWFNATVRAYWKHLFYWWDLLLLFCFCSNQENLYMIHHDWNLLYEIYNAITEYNWIQTHYLSSIPNYFDIFFLRESKSWLYVLVMSRTRFRVNPHSIFGQMVECSFKN